MSDNEITDIQFVERKSMPAYTLRGTATWNFLDSFLKMKHSAKDIKLKQTPLEHKTLEPCTPKGISFDKHVTDRISRREVSSFFERNSRYPKHHERNDDLHIGSH